MKEIGKSSEGGAFDEMAALKWQVMRMEGVMAASLNDTGATIVSLAGKLEQLVASQQAEAAGGRCLDPNQRLLAATKMAFASVMLSSGLILSLASYRWSLTWCRMFDCLWIQLTADLKSSGMFGGFNP